MVLPWVDGQVKLKIKRMDSTCLPLTSYFHMEGFLLLGFQRRAHFLEHLCKFVCLLSSSQVFPVLNMLFLQQVLLQYFWKEHCPSVLGRWNGVYFSCCKAHTHIGTSFPLSCNCGVPFSQLVAGFFFFLR